MKEFKGLMNVVDCFICEDNTATLTVEPHVCTIACKECGVSVAGTTPDSAIQSWNKVQGDLQHYYNVLKDCFDRRELAR